jgi:hypothetical protein
MKTSTKMMLAGLAMLVLSLVLGFGGALLDDLRNPPFKNTAGVAYIFSGVFGFIAIVLTTAGGQKFEEEKR